MRARAPRLQDEHRHQAATSLPRERVYLFPVQYAAARCNGQMRQQQQQHNEPTLFGARLQRGVSVR